ncbi:exodeoxyribonuclease VII small subunit [Helicobacter sp. MIT 21-1697]|uniref:exodeoxyribonuclease VII small subunit n=1 Tax=Helicobacter sp. MIT 21-1697 TaxID=2993733 RepID=UPI00224B3FA1|nr:exodeoxyribonuclease VII small subunit [Helicobacter sp. MIT 21-1697]MCX2716158.1 exodeoxyribonuclease VII small subunit [Helicobacter sp. MIT 21-1697]
MADSKKQKTISQTNVENKKNEAIQEEDFEGMLERAKEVLGKLNAQEITLKESLALYEQGMQSLKNAQEILEQAKLQYQELKD